MKLTDMTLLDENRVLNEQLEEYKDIVEGIRTGGVDALAISKDGRSDIYSLEGTDFVYRVLVENFAEGALNISDTGLILYANPAFENLLGSAPVSVIGMDMISLVDDRHKKTFEKLFKDAFSGVSKGEIVLSFRKRKISVHISLSSLYPRFKGIGILITDLSEKRYQEVQLSSYRQRLSKQEQQLMQAEISQASTEKFRWMADAIPQKIWTADPEGKMDYFNSRWAEYTNIKNKVLMKSGWKEIIHEQDWAATQKIREESIVKGEGFEIEHRLLNSEGHYRWHLTRVVPKQDEKGRLVMWVGTTTDIHIQKAFAEELGLRVHQATVFLQTIFDSSEEVITSFDANFNFTSMNRVAANYTDIELHDFVGKNLFDVFPGLKESPYRLTLERVLKGEYIHKKETIKVRGMVRIFDTHYKPLVINQEVSGIVIVATDITDFLNMTNVLNKAKQQLEEQFVDIEKKNQELLLVNAELLSFTYVASHDLNEPLRKIKLFCTLILERQKDMAPETCKLFESVTSSAARMQKLIEALLSYSQINSGNSSFAETDLAAVLDTVLANLSELLEEKKAKVQSRQLPVLNVIPYQFNQLFTNIISNAVKYSRPDVCPLIVVSYERVPASEIETGVVPPNSHYHKISFSDNGIGFDQIYHLKIFELFQRLNKPEDYAGTGIGLAICAKIAANHQGYINACGDPGTGSVFNIYIPENL
jgi:PAS domain S-box-containing protein